MRYLHILLKILIRSDQLTAAMQHATSYKSTTSVAIENVVHIFAHQTERINGSLPNMSTNAISEYRTVYSVCYYWYFHVFGHFRNLLP